MCVLANPRRIGAVATEPITMDEAKAHIGLTGTFHHDQLLAMYVPAARDAFEQRLSRPLAPCKFSIALDCWPEWCASAGAYLDPIRVQYPVISVERISFWRLVTASDADGIPTWGGGTWNSSTWNDADPPKVYVREDLASGDYYASKDINAEGKIYLTRELPAPDLKREGIEIEFSSGLLSLEPALRHGLLMLTAHAFQNREPVLVSDAGGTSIEIPQLLQPIVDAYEIQHCPCPTVI